MIKTLITGVIKTKSILRLFEQLCINKIAQIVNKIYFRLLFNLEYYILISNLLLMFEFLRICDQFSNILLLLVKVSNVL